MSVVKPEKVQNINLPDISSDLVAVQFFSTVKKSS